MSSHAHHPSHLADRRIPHNRRSFPTFTPQHIMLLASMLLIAILIVSNSIASPTPTIPSGSNFSDQFQPIADVFASYHHEALPASPFHPSMILAILASSIGTCFLIFCISMWRASSRRIPTSTPSISKIKTNRLTRPPRRHPTISTSHRSTDPRFAPSALDQLPLPPLSVTPPAFLPTPPSPLVYSSYFAGANFHTPSPLGSATIKRLSSRTIVWGYLMLIVSAALFTGANAADSPIHITGLHQETLPFPASLAVAAANSPQHHQLATPDSSAGATHQQLHQPIATGVQPGAPAAPNPFVHGTASAFTAVHSANPTHSTSNPTVSSTATTLQQQQPAPSHSAPVVAHRTHESAGPTNSQQHHQQRDQRNNNDDNRNDHYREHDYNENHHHGGGRGHIQSNNEHLPLDYDRYALTDQFGRRRRSRSHSPRRSSPRDRSSPRTFGGRPPTHHDDSAATVGTSNDATSTSRRMPPPPSRSYAHIVVDVPTGLYHFLFTEFSIMPKYRFVVNSIIQSGVSSSRELADSFPDEVLYLPTKYARCQVDNIADLSDSDLHELASRIDKFLSKNYKADIDGHPHLRYGTRPTLEQIAHGEKPEHANVSLLIHPRFCPISEDEYEQTLLQFGSLRVPPRARSVVPNSSTPISGQSRQTRSPNRPGDAAAQVIESNVELFSSGRATSEQVGSRPSFFTSGILGTPGAVQPRTAVHLPHLPAVGESITDDDGDDHKSAAPPTPSALGAGLRTLSQALEPTTDRAPKRRALENTTANVLQNSLSRRISTNPLHIHHPNLPASSASNSSGGGGNQPPRPPTTQVAADILSSDRRSDGTVVADQSPSPPPSSYQSSHSSGFIRRELLRSQRRPTRGSGPPGGDRPPVRGYCDGPDDDPSDDPYDDPMYDDDSQRQPSRRSHSVIIPPVRSPSTTSTSVSAMQTIHPPRLQAAKVHMALFNAAVDTDIGVYMQRFHAWLCATRVSTELWVPTVALFFPTNVPLLGSLMELEEQLSHVKDPDQSFLISLWQQAVSIIVEHYKLPGSAIDNMRNRLYNVRKQIDEPIALFINRFNTCLQRCRASDISESEKRRIFIAALEEDVARLIRITRVADSLSSTSSWMTFTASIAPTYENRTPHERDRVMLEGIERQLRDDQHAAATRTGSYQPDRLHNTAILTTSSDYMSLSPAQQSLAVLDPFATPKILTTTIAQFKNSPMLDPTNKRILEEIQNNDRTPFNQNRKQGNKQAAKTESSAATPVAAVVQTKQEKKPNKDQSKSNNKKQQVKKESDKSSGSSASASSTPAAGSAYSALYSERPTKALDPAVKAARENQPRGQGPCTECGSNHNVSSCPRMNTPGNAYYTEQAGKHRGTGRVPQKFDRPSTTVATLRVTCGSFNKNRDRQIVAPVLIAGRYCEQTLVDTGAGYNFMSEHVFNSLPREIQQTLVRTDIIVGGADNREIIPLGVLRIPVTFIANHQGLELTTTLQFIVVPTLCTPVIFGLQTLRHLTTHIDIASLTLRFRPQEFESVTSIPIHYRTHSCEAATDTPISAARSSSSSRPSSSSSSSSSTRLLPANSRQYEYERSLGFEPSTSSVEFGSSLFGSGYQFKEIDNNRESFSTTTPSSSSSSSPMTAIPTATSNKRRLSQSRESSAIADHMTTPPPRGFNPFAGHKSAFVGHLFACKGVTFKPHSWANVACDLIPPLSSDQSDSVFRIIPYVRHNKWGDVSPITFEPFYHSGLYSGGINSKIIEMYNESDVTESLQPLDALACVDAYFGASEEQHQQLNTADLQYYVSALNTITPTYERPHTESRIVKPADKQNSVDFDINPSLPSREYSIIFQALMKYQSLFIASNPLSPPRAHGVKHVIRVPADCRPIKQNAYRSTPKNRETIESEVKRLLDAKYITPSVSAWASPVILVPKADGTQRMCIDYRRLNNSVIKDGYPLPRIEDCLHQLRTAVHLSIIDLKEAFHHIPLDEASRELSAFVTPSGLYQWNVMTFGHTNAPGTFQRYMAHILHEHVNKCCVVYFDDIVVYSSDTIENHVAALEKVLGSIKSANLSAKASKCHFAYNQIKFLGHVIMKGNIHPDPAKIAAVTEFPIPKDASQVRSFLGLANYYRNFVKSFATIAKPLYQLTRKGFVFQWTPTEQAAFDNLKSKLSSAPCLASPDYDRPFILQTDASYDGLGAVLSQKDDNDVEHPVAFASTQLNDAQTRYAVTELEVASLVWAIKQFEYMLHDRHFTIVTDHKAATWLPLKGSPNKRLLRAFVYLSQFNFTVVYRKGKAHGNADGISRGALPIQAGERNSDSPLPTETSLLAPIFVVSDSPYSGLFTPSHNTTRHVSQALAASRYIDTLTDDRHRAGKQMTFCAPLTTATSSAITPFSTSTSSNKKYEGYGPKTARSDNNPYYSYTIEDSSQRTQLIECQSQDPQIRPIIDWKKNGTLPSGIDSKQLNDIRSKSANYVIGPDDGGLYYIAPSRYQQSRPSLAFHSNMRLVIPKIFRLSLLHLFHNTPFGGHLGITKTYNRLSARYYWTTLWDDTSNFIKQCYICQQEKVNRQKSATQREPSITATSPFETISLDFVGPLPQSEDFKYILVVVDIFTRWTIAVPCLTQNANVVASVILDQVCCQHGTPKHILTDQGSQFVSKFLEPLWRLLKIDKRQSTVYHPQSNGVVERANGTIKTVLRCICEQHPSVWASMLQMATFAHNTSVHSLTGFTPFYMIHGRHPNIPGSFDAADIDVIHDSRDAAQQYVSHVLQSRSEAYNSASQSFADAYRRTNSIIGKSHYVRTLAVGDRVMYQSPHSKLLSWKDTSVETARRQDEKTPSQRKHFVKQFNGPFIVTGIISDKVYTIRPLDFPNAPTDNVNIQHLKYIPPRVNRDIVDVSNDLTQAIASQQQSASDTAGDDHLMTPIDEEKSSNGSASQPPSRTSSSSDTSPSVMTSATSNLIQQRQPSRSPSSSIDLTNSASNSEPTAPQSSHSKREAVKVAEQMRLQNRINELNTVAQARKSSNRLRSIPKRNESLFDPNQKSTAISTEPHPKVINSPPVAPAEPIDNSKFNVEVPLLVDDARAPTRNTAPIPSRSTRLHPKSLDAGIPMPTMSSKRQRTAKTGVTISSIAVPLTERRSTRNRDLVNYSESDLVVPLAKSHIKRLSQPLRKP